MIHKTAKVIISATPNNDILFIKKGTRNGRVTLRLATFLSYDKWFRRTINTIGIATDLSLYLEEKLDRLHANEFITIEITTHKKSD